jgi:hypothetical protein
MDRHASTFGVMGHFVFTKLGSIIAKYKCATDKALCLTVKPSSPFLSYTLLIYQCLHSRFAIKTYDV